MENLIPVFVAVFLLIYFLTKRKDQYFGAGISNIVKIVGSVVLVLAGIGFGIWLLWQGYILQHTVYLK